MEKDRTHAVFPQTQWEIVLAARGENTEASHALAELCQAYWFPLYAFARGSGRSASDAEDLVQGFLSKVIEKGTLDSADSEKGKLRTFLLTAFRRYSRDEYAKSIAGKRGGGAVVSLEAGQAENWYEAEQIDGESPEATFDRQWALTVLEKAVNRLESDWRSRDKADEFAVLRPFLTATGGSEDYEEIGRQLGMEANTVKVTIHRLRAKYGAALREEVRETGLGDSDVDEELRYLLTLL